LKEITQIKTDKSSFRIYKDLIDQTKTFRYNLINGSIEITDMIRKKDFYGRLIQHIDLVIPSHIDSYPVRSIGESSFLRKTLKCITIPAGILHIGENAFDYNEFTNVKIPNSVQSIGKEAFNNNIILSNVTLPVRLKKIENYVFHGNCLKNITIPETVTSIGEGSFYGNQLTSVTIPESVTSIGRSSFSDNQLTNVIISKSVKSIGDNAFFNNQLTSVTIPESVENLGDGVFWYNQLTEIHIPNSVTHIGGLAFSNNNIERVVIGEKVESIGDDAFSDQNEKLKQVIILGDETRFNDQWEKIGFPKELMPKEMKKASFNRSVEVKEIDHTQFISNILEGKQIVITGTLKHFTRQTIKDTIIKLGGKVQSSITANTDYVIKGFENTGSKLDKAKEKNILIKHEEAFLKEITQIKTDENKSEKNDIKDRLKKLKELLEEDLITEDEYNVKREQILKEL
jgi:hypothetical protein